MNLVPTCRNRLCLTSRTPANDWPPALPPRARFAEVMANRLWKRLMGAGLVEKVDDWEGKTPSDPLLLAYLTDELIRSGYDFKALTRLIMNSKAYQRRAIDLPENLIESDLSSRAPTVAE